MTYAFHAQIIVQMDDHEPEIALPILNFQRIEKMLNQKKFKKIIIDTNVFGSPNPIITIDARKKEFNHG